MSEEISKAIAERLQEIADKLFNGNQAEMSRAMGMSPQGMNPYFNGERKPGYKIIKRLVDLGVNATWILSGIQPMMISDITEAGVLKIDYVNDEMKDEYRAKENDSFSHINPDLLSETERALLAEAKHFSDFLKKQRLPLQVKRLMLELMIEHIDQEIARLRNNDS